MFTDKRKGKEKIDPLSNWDEKFLILLKEAWKSAAVR